MAELLTGVASATGLGSTTPNRTIALSGNSSAGRTGISISSQGPFQGMVLDLPAVSLAMTGITGQFATLALAAPIPTLAMAGTTPAAVQLYLTVPAPALAMSAVTGRTGTLTLEVPAISLRMSGSDGLTLTVPMPTLAMAAVTGNTAIFAPRIAMPTLAMTAITNALATLNITVPVPTLNLQGRPGVAGALYLPVPAPALRMAANVGLLGTLALTVPAPVLSFAGGFAAVGKLFMTVPVPAELMQGFTTTPTPTVTAERVTYALQTERMALTKYQNFPFNSFATFKGKLLGMTDSGVFELVGDTDSGTQIDAEIRTGITDMNTSRIKRVDRVYIGYRAQRNHQSLILRVLTDETQQRDYGIPASVASELHGARTRLGMGMAARYWQFGLLNRSGENFTVDSIEVAPIPFSRRRGPKDA